MRKFLEETKGYRSSRNLDATRRVKNSTQLVAISSSSRNASSNIALNNLSATSRIRNSLKGSITNNNLFSNRSKAKDFSKKSQNLQNCTRNRRADIGRNSVEELKSFKSNNTNKSIDEKVANLRQAT